MSAAGIDWDQLPDAVVELVGDDQIGFRPQCDHRLVATPALVVSVRRPLVRFEVQGRAVPPKGHVEPIAAAGDPKGCSADGRRVELPAYGG